MTGTFDFEAAREARDETARERQQRKFRAFDAANPHVYELFQKFTLDAIRAGRKRFGARMIWERMRWYTMVEAKDQTDFKLNDHYPPYYARKFMGEHVSYQGFFELRGEDTA